MGKRPIRFYYQETTFRVQSVKLISGWLNNSIQSEGRSILHADIIICSDDFLLNINQQFLNHDYYTDIITFDYSAEKKEGSIEGELYISIDRVKENAKKHKITTHEELRRVMIHGLLHLCGLKDKTTKEKANMRAAENKHLQQFEAFSKTFHVKHS